MRPLTKLVLILSAPLSVLHHAKAECACCAAPTLTALAPKANDAPVRHPLKGVVVNVVADRSALLVKHEEVPGVMKAMTMLLKVDTAALASVKKGDAINGQLVRKADGWWLEEVKVAAVTT